MSRTPIHDREETLARARDLFWRKGYHATSMKDLEKALDMRPGSIYAAFNSKENLFIEALDNYAEQTRVELKTLENSSNSPLSALASFVRGFGNLCDRDLPSAACMIVKTILETDDDLPAIRNHASLLLSRSEETFAEMFRRAKLKRELSENLDPQRLATRLQAEIMGLRSYAEKSRDPLKIERLADDIASTIELYRRKDTST